MITPRAAVVLALLAAMTGGCATTHPASPTAAPPAGAPTATAGASAPAASPAPRPPEPGPTPAGRPLPAPADTDLPPPTRESLPNGLTLIIQEHRASDIVAIHLWINVGVRYEAPDGLGYAHFQEHMLFKGTDTWGPGYFDRAVEGVGGRSNAVTSHDYTNFYVLVPSDALDKGLGLLADMAFRSKFDPEEIGREREVIFEEARIEQDNPRAAVVRGLYGIVFDGNPYGRPVLGTTATMNAATRDKLVAFNQRYYTPENMSVVVVGPVSPPAVRAAVARAFGQKPRTGLAREPAPAPRPLSGVVRRKVERPEQQAYIAMGWLAPRSDDPDGYPVDLLTAILAGTESSRLARRLRDEERLVTYLTMSYAALQGGGIVSLRAEGEAKDLDRIERIVLEEIARMQESGPTADELKLAVTKFEAEHAATTETTEGLAGAYGIAEATWNLEAELTYVDSLRKVTPEQVRDAARKWLARERFARLDFVPKAP